MNEEIQAKINDTVESEENDYIVELKKPVTIGDVEYRDKIDMSGVENITTAMVKKAIRVASRKSAIMMYQADLNVQLFLVSQLLNCVPEDFDSVPANITSALCAQVQSFLMNVD